MARCKGHGKNSTRGPGSLSLDLDTGARFLIVRFTSTSSLETWSDIGEEDRGTQIFREADGGSKLASCLTLISEGNHSEVRRQIPNDEMAYNYVKTTENSLGAAINRVPGIRCKEVRRFPIVIFQDG